MVEVFPNAPIREAILDIRTDNLAHGSPEDLKKLRESVKEKYPITEERKFLNIAMQISQNPAPDTQSGFHGYFFESQDKEKIFQARIDGFTFNKLRPYNDWKKFSEEAKSLWELYYQSTQPAIISRLALRYINHINIPLPITDFKDYILTTPEIAPGLPQSLDHFFMRLAITDPITGASTIIIQTFETPTENFLPIIFDIDVSFTKSFESNTSEIWFLFDKLREAKNRFFFNSLTERTKELFR